MAGYDEKTKTITCSIPITVRPVKGKLPTIKAKEWKEGEKREKKTVLSLLKVKLGNVSNQLEQAIPNSSIEKLNTLTEGR